jgi:glutamine synthetase
MPSAVGGPQPATAAVCVSRFRVISKREPKMTKYKLEYIWLDGYKPVPNLRGKTQLKDYDSLPTLEELPLWGFDGSSTQQAEGHSSDCVLKPVAVYPDGARTNGLLVLCEVMMPDGSPHPSNMRATILDDPGAWFGFEQEYFFYKDGRPLGFPETGYPAPQGPYYTGVGYKNVGDIARKMVEEHLDLCLFAGINHEGINAEVAKGQWEFQIFGKGSKKAADEMWMARYLLERLTEKYGVDIQYHCKPLGATDWNGSGMHANFSTVYLRETGGKAYFEALMEAFKAAKEDHIAVYGPDNHMRLTGKHETAAITDFTYGVADRGASIRVPHSFIKNDYRGYLEDRRPNSQGDPYQIASQILKTIDVVPKEFVKSAAA